MSDEEALETFNTVKWIALVKDNVRSC